jgi:hypothetical protein
LAALEIQKLLSILYNRIRLFATTIKIKLCQSSRKLEHFINAPAAPASTTTSVGPTRKTNHKLLTSITGDLVPDRPRTMPTRASTPPTTSTRNKGATTTITEKQIMASTMAPPFPGGKHLKKETGKKLRNILPNPNTIVTMRRSPLEIEKGKWGTTREKGGGIVPSISAREGGAVLPRVDLAAARRPRGLRISSFMQNAVPQIG